MRTGVGFVGYDDSKSALTNLERLGMPDVVIAFKPLEHHGFHKLPCLKIMQYNEIHEVRFKQEMKEARPDVVIMHHYNEYLRWQSKLIEWGVRSAHIPHVADTFIWKPWELPKLWDVMLVGSMSSKVYPLRHKFLDAMAILRGRGWKCMRYEHPGNLLDNADTNWHLVQCAQAISQARIACFCSSIYRYRLQKFVEAPACGTLIASDMPVCEPGERVPMIQCDVSDSVEDIADRLESHLQSWDSELCQQTWEYGETYTPEYYCERLLEIIDDAKG